MNKFQLTLRCKNWRCDHHRKPYKRTVYVPDGESIDDQPNPPCPKCSKKAKVEDTEEQPQAALPITPMEEWIENGKGPAQIGKSNTVKAIDMAADIAMQDYGLTNLKDNVREGESMAPSLPPAQQRLADTFFTPAKNPSFNSRRQKQLQMLGQRAIKGAFRSTALDVKAVLPDARVGLRRAGTEIVNNPKR